MKISFRYASSGDKTVSWRGVIGKVLSVHGISASHNLINPFKTGNAHMRHYKTFLTSGDAYIVTLIHICRKSIFTRNNYESS